MKSILLPVLVLAVAALALATAEGVTGKWQIHQSVVGNENDLSCTFTQTGDDIAGTCDGPSGAVKIAGKVADKKVTWSFNSEYNGSPLTIKYSGTLTSETKMAGTLAVDPYGVEGEFTATLAR
jgi:hypothetical protein